MDEFEIIYTVYQDGQPHPKRFNVQRIYQSDQVERYRVYSTNKEIVLEKRMLAKRSPWKVLSINFEMKNPDSKSVTALNFIWDRIDEYFHNKRQSSYRSPEERHSNW